MPCTRSANRDDERGSAVAGFALTAPVAVVVFIAVIQVIALAQLRTTVHSAAATGARLAATLGSTTAAGSSAADGVLRAHAVAPERVARVWRHSTISGVPYLSLTLEVPARITWVRRVVTVSSTVRVTDENAL